MKNARARVHAIGLALRLRVRRMTVEPKTSATVHLNSIIAFHGNVEPIMFMKFLTRTFKVTL